MPRLLDGESRTNEIVRGICRLILREGLEGIQAFLPATSSDVSDTRVWLAMEEIGRSHPIIGQDVSHARDRERWTLSTSTTPALGARDAQAGYAAVDGLRVAVCATHDPMPLDFARELLETSVRRLLPAA